MKSKGQFSRLAPFNYQSHQSLNKFKKAPVQERADEVAQEIFKVKLKGQQSRLVSRTAPTKQDQNKELKRHIKMLETQLKKKILENPILNRLLKTKHNSELSHIDIYLQFLKYKQVQDQLRQQQQKDRLAKEELAVQNEKLKQQIQNREGQFVEEIQKAGSQFTKLQKEYKNKLKQKENMFQQETIQRQEKIQEVNFVVNELQAKNKKLTRSIKQQDENFIQKSRQMNKQKSQLQKQLKRVNQRVNQLQSELTLQRKQSENLIFDKETTIQQLNKFIDLQNNSRQQKERQDKIAYEQKIIEMSKKHEKEIAALQRQYSQEIRQAHAQFQSKQERISQKLGCRQTEYRQKQLQFDNLISVQKELNKQMKFKIEQLQAESVNLKKKYTLEIQQIKGDNTALLNDKEDLINQLFDLEKQLNQKTQELDTLTYQNVQLQNKYEKGSSMTQKDKKYKEEVIQNLQKRIFMLGHENTKLKNWQEQRSSSEAKSKQIKKMSQKQICEKYKSIGRIEEINHKMQTFLIKQTQPQNQGGHNFDQGNFNSNSNLRIAPNSKKLESISLCEHLETTSKYTDQILDIFKDIQRSSDKLAKAKMENQSQIISIFNHLMDNTSSDQDLEEDVRDYIRLIKQESFQSGQQLYVENKKKQLYQAIIQGLIQMKVIKSYSSAGSHFDQPIRHNNQAYDSVQDSNFIKRASRVTRKNYQQAEVNYASNPNSDSLQGNLSKVLFENSRVRKNKYHLGHSIQRSKQRFSTQPVSVEEQSTYEIHDENWNLQNFIQPQLPQVGRPSSSNKETRSRRSSCQKPHKAIRDRLRSSNENTIKSNFKSAQSNFKSNGQISKEDIEKKYFMR